MADEDGLRDYVLRVRGEAEDLESFDGAMVRAATAGDAALKAARWLEPASSEEAAESGSTEMRLRESDSGEVRIYRAWAWEEDAPDDGPAWLGDTLTRSDVEEVDEVEPRID